MTKEQRTARLRQIMADHNLTAKAVGFLLNRSAQTVRSWRCRYELRAIPENELKLIEAFIYPCRRPELPSIAAEIAEKHPGWSRERVLSEAKALCTAKPAPAQTPSA